MEFIDRLKVIEEALYESEKLGGEILLNKQQLVDYDKKRQANRECLRAISNAYPVQEIGPESSQKIWLCTGSNFIKLPVSKAVTTIQKDQAQIETALSKTQEELKEQVARIESIEADCKGIKETRANSFKVLRPLSSTESFEDIITTKREERIL